MPAPGLCPYTLKHLELRMDDDVFEPNLLAPMTHLQHLHLSSDLQLTSGASQALLAQLARMTQLTCLSLVCAFDTDVPAASFAAITASSMLQELSFMPLWSYELLGHKAQMPFSAIWQHAFPPELKLLELHTLKLAGPWKPLISVAPPTGVSPWAVELPTGLPGWVPLWDSHCSEQSASISSASDAEPSISWQEQCLSRLVSCCPHLQCLDIVQALPDVRMAPLLSLQHLTSLTVRCHSNADAQHVCARLSGLQELVLGHPLQPYVPGRITSASLSRLSVLQLTRLHLIGDGMSRAPKPIKPKTEDEWPSEESDEEGDEIGSGDHYSVTDTTLGILAGLTSLRELELCNHMDMTDGGLLQLTALRQLTELIVQGPVGLLGATKEDESLVYLPTVAWARGSTCEKPLWPMVLEHVLRSRSHSARQLAQQSVLANRQALLDTLGYPLATALSHRVLQHMTYENYEAEYLIPAGQRGLQQLEVPATYVSDDADGDNIAPKQTAGNGAVAAGQAKSDPAAATEAAGGPERGTSAMPEAVAWVQGMTRGKVIQQEEIRTAATALSDRLPLLVQLLASSRGAANMG